MLTTIKNILVIVFRDSVPIFEANLTHAVSIYSVHLHTHHKTV